MVIHRIKARKKTPEKLAEKKATGRSLGLSPVLCNRITPTPWSDASTATVNGFSGSGCCRGAVVKAVFSFLKADSAVSFHLMRLGDPFRRS